jgi:hypothetical protein
MCYNRGGLLCSSSFDWGLLDRMSFLSLSFIRFIMAGSVSTESENT